MNTLEALTKARGWKFACLGSLNVEGHLAQKLWVAYSSFEPLNRGPMTCSIHSILLRAIEILLARKTLSVLTFGYRQPQSHRAQSIVRGSYSVENYAPNTIVNHLKSRPFQDLYEQLGDDAFLYLLVHNCLFLRLESGSFCQLSGPPVFDAPLYSSSSVPTSGPIHSPKSNILVQKIKSKSEPILWSRIFYSFASFDAHGQVHTGLSRHHDLLRLPESELFQVIFPNEKLPLSSRLIPFKPIVKRAVKAANGVRFQRLLDENCPVPDRNSFQKCMVDGKVTFLKLHCSYNQVASFLSKALDRFFPGLFEDSNYSVFKGHILDLVSKRRFEKCSIEQLVRGLKVTQIRWLQPTKSFRPVPTDLGKRMQLLCNFMTWLVDGLIVPLLRTNFYVTESSPFSKRTFYFRHETWNRLCAPLYSSIQESMYERVSPETIQHLLDSKKSFGACRIRLLPKIIGARPITNLKRKLRTDDPTSKPTKKINGVSMNQLLQNAFQILSFEKVSRIHDRIIVLNY